MRTFIPSALSLALAIVSASILNAAPASAPAATRSDVAAGCDASIQSAVRSSLGWGWPAPETPRDAGPFAIPPAGGDGAAKPPAAPPGVTKPKPAAVARKKRDLPPIDARETAAIGLELLWASQLFNNDSYRNAAIEAGRGLMALQTRAGQVRTGGSLSPGGVKELIGGIPDRDSTQAALALWTELLQFSRSTTPGGAGQRDTSATRPVPGASAESDEAAIETNMVRVKAAMFASAYWLGKQQSTVGAWPSLYPPDAPSGRGTRLIRLDDGDHRDCAFALLLASEAVDGRDLMMLYDRAIDYLLGLRVTYARSPGRTLWASAYDFSGQPTRKFAAFSEGVDLLASRFAMQALLADYLVTLKPRGDKGLHDAVDAVRTAPRDDHQRWHRFYDRLSRPVEPTPRSGGQHELFPDPLDSDRMLGTFGLDRLLATADEVNKVGGDPFGKSLEARWPLHSRLATMLVGLSADALRDVPAGPEPATIRPTFLSPRTLELWEALRREIGEKEKS